MFFFIAVFILHFYSSHPYECEWELQNENRKINDDFFYRNFHVAPWLYNDLCHSYCLDWMAPYWATVWWLWLALFLLSCERDERIKYDSIQRFCSCCCKNNYYPIGNWSMFVHNFTSSQTWTEFNMCGVEFKCNIHQSPLVYRINPFIVVSSRLSTRVSNEFSTYLPYTYMIEKRPQQLGKTNKNKV